MIGFDAIGQSAIGEISSADDVRIIAPSATVAATTFVPIIIGTEIFPPLVTVTAAVTAPSIRAGKSEFPAVAAVAITTFAPRISIGATIHPTAINVGVTTSPPQPQSGNVVFASNTITMDTTFGEIGSMSIGELAIGEGEPSTRVAKSPPFAIVTTTPPLVAAGKSIFPTGLSVIATSSRPEIDSRRRKLRVFAIAS